jgi:serine/tyrosine/threonine adenylyltransferase
MAMLPDIKFDNTFARDMEGFYVAWKPEAVSAPKVVRLNTALANDLGLDAAALLEEEGALAAAIFSGNLVPAGAYPVAQVYAGHQFGGFSEQLGDGRALLLGEVIDVYGQRQDIALKGSGKTPFSRGGDGKAALGPVLREYLVAEAMYALGIPTTRALAATTTGEAIFRDAALPGAVLTRVAASHLRVGTLQFFAARGEWDKVRQLADYALLRHYPAVAKGLATAANSNPYLALLQAVGQAQARLVAQWMLVGFIHGVMNTDNMTLSGQTIDYGPCAFMDHYKPATVFSSIDRQGRYAYANQPHVARWNMARLAEALLPLVHDDQDLALQYVTEVIDAFPLWVDQAWLRGMRAKLGLTSEQVDDGRLAEDLLVALEGQQADYTLVMRNLSKALLGDDRTLEGLLANPLPLRNWLVRWRARLALDPMEPSVRAAAMNAVNPLYIPRNHKVEEAIQAAVEEQNLAPFDALLDVVTHPYQERAGLQAYAKGAAVDAPPYRTFCGT